MPRPTRRRSGACVAAKSPKLAACARLRAVVEAKLELRWSPQQISGWLVETFPDDPEMRVSHETIYLSLFVQSRGALRKELTRYLRSGHSTRRPKGHTVMNGQGQLRGTLNIRERPADANDRAVPGHWEGDLLMGKRMHAMATLVERKTRFVMLIALPNGHAADVVADALAAKIVELPEQLRRSLTWDQGKEMADHARFSDQHRRAGLLLRPAQSLAARQQREHQRSAPPVLPQTHRDRALQPSRSRRRRSRTQRPPSTNPRLEDTITSTRRSVAMNLLNPQPFGSRPRRFQSGQSGATCDTEVHVAETPWVEGVGRSCSAGRACNAVASLGGSRDDRCL